MIAHALAVVVRLADAGALGREVDLVIRAARRRCVDRLEVLRHELHVREDLVGGREQARDDVVALDDVVADTIQRALPPATT